jgi:septal ring factor EnvC (AmiA/AmiB activator)
MEMRTAFDLAVALVAFLGGWFLKVMSERIERLEQARREEAKELADLRVTLATHYTSKDDFKAMADAIFGALRRIEEKLDRKVDKG